MGADIIKIERPGVGNLRRHTTTAGWDVVGEATSFLAVNRNKRGLTLNLKADEGHRIGMDLAVDADVFVHNYRPDVMERLGFGYEDVKQFNGGSSTSTRRVSAPVARTSRRTSSDGTS